MKKYITALFLGFLMLANPSWADSTGFKPLAEFDLDNFQGQWHEVALIPYFFQKNCAKNALVKYTPIDGKDKTFMDYFYCEKEDGDTTEMTGRVKVVGHKDYPDSNAVMSATFFKLFGFKYWFGKNYWVFGYKADDEGNAYMLVGQPDVDKGWVFSRQPKLTDEFWVEVLRTIKTNGYDLCDFQVSPQSKGLQEPKALCELTSNSES